MEAKKKCSADFGVLIGRLRKLLVGGWVATGQIKDEDIRCHAGLLLNLLGERLKLVAGAAEQKQVSAMPSIDQRRLLPDAIACTGHQDPPAEEELRIRLIVQ